MMIKVYLGTNFGVPNSAVMSKSSKIRRETVENYWAFGAVLNLSNTSSLTKYYALLGNPWASELKYQNKTENFPFSDIS